MTRLPDIRQQQSHQCGVALAQAVCVAFGVTCPRVVCSAKWGVQAADLADALDGAGLVAQAGRMDAGDLRHHLRRGRVVCCVVPVGDVGHWVGVWRAGPRWVWYHDPDRGPSREDYTRFRKRWERFGQWSVAAGLS